MIHFVDALVRFCLILNATLIVAAVFICSCLFLLISFDFFFNLSRPILSQVKLKAPLILPGFQAVETSEDFSGQCSVCCF